MQAVLEVAKKNFESPDSVPVYFAHELPRSIEDAKRVLQEHNNLREQTTTLQKQNKNLQVWATTLKRKLRKERKTLRVMQNTRAWRILTMAVRLRKKLFRR
jgi:hypothetical protein